MLYNVAQFLKEEVGASRKVEISGDLADLDERNPGPVSVSGTASMVRTPKGVLVTGKVRMRLSQVCRRCLELAEMDWESAFEEEFVPTIDLATGMPIAREEDVEPELLIDEQNMLDMTEILRQYAVMELMAPSLCRPDCKGLCFMCGHNLNHGPCECEEQVMDPRFAVLAQLLDDQGELDTDD